MKYKNASETARAKGKWQGMNWIRQEKRLAIYLRDGFACTYCGSTVEDGARLTLDHITPHSSGGTNHETNLVTCCANCNSSRGNRSLVDFAEAVANYLNHGVTSEQIIDHVNDCVSRDFKKAKKEAKELISRRGSLSKVLKAVVQR